MSTFVIGFKPPDGHFEKMREVWLACEAAGITPPTEVNKFFDYTPPDKEGVEVYLANDLESRDDAVSLWVGDGKTGFQVDLAKLDPDIKILRFYNSW